MFYWILNELSTPFVPGLQDAKGIQINVPRKRIRSSCVRYLHDVHVSFLSLWLKFFMHRTPKRLRISVACPPTQASSIISYIMFYVCIYICIYIYIPMFAITIFWKMLILTGYSTSTWGSMHERLWSKIVWNRSAVPTSHTMALFQFVETYAWSNWRQFLTAQVDNQEIELNRSKLRRWCAPNFWNEEDFNGFNLISLVASVVSRDELYRGYHRSLDRSWAKPTASHWFAGTGAFSIVCHDAPGKDIEMEWNGMSNQTATFRYMLHCWNNIR